MSQRNKISDSGQKQPDSEQFDRFEQLTRRLLTVPKQEADKEQAKKPRKKDR